MKIQDNGVLRDMTAEEEAALLEAQGEATDEEALAILLGGADA